MKNKRIANTTMADQLRKEFNLPEGTSLGSRYNKPHEHFDKKKDFKPRNKNSLSKEVPNTKDNLNNNLDFSQQAALAIATNIAESRIKSIFQKTQNSANEGWYDGICNEFKAWLENYRQPQQASSSSTTQSSLPTIPYQKELLTLWDAITLNLADKRQRYKTEHSKQLDMLELILQLNKLRNFFSHMSRMGDPFDLKDSPQLGYLLQMLYTEASTAISVRQPFTIVHQGHQLDAIWGSAFIINLFLPLSQANRLLQQLSKKKPLKKRELRLFSYYSLRDGYSPTQLDTQANLCREIIGYLTLPPIESEAGQKALHEWQQQLLEEADSIQSPCFRRLDKVRYYLHTTLDELSLLPQLSFWGTYKNKQTISYLDENGETVENNNLALWVNQADPEPIKQANIDTDSVSQTPSKTKNIRHHSYNRNNLIQNQSQRFVYDMSDGNIRFKIEHPTNKDLPILQGVIRLRDFINLGYLALTDKAATQEVLIAIYNWLNQYQQSLQQITTEQLSSLTLQPENYQYYSEQIQQYLTQTKPDLATRLKTRITERLSRIQKLLAKDRTVPEVQSSTIKQLNQFKHYLPRHEQVHEILHYFIANLNKEGREKVTRHEFVHMQKLLLQYKGDTNPNEIEQIKNPNPNKPNRTPSDKALFWQHLHDNYPKELVTGNKTHPIWEFAITESKQLFNDKKRKGVISLGMLCSKVLNKQIQQLQSFAKELASNTDDYSRLSQIAAELQLGLKGNYQGEQPKEDISRGLPAAIHNASCYSVIPTSFIQQTLNKQSEKPQPIGKCGIEKSVNFAQLIRNHPTALKLIKDYYEASKAQSTLAQKIVNHNNTLAGLTPEQKKQWKQTIKTLNDWHTHDKLCLIMAEKLAEKANIHFEQDETITTIAQQQPTLKLTGKSPNGDPKTVILKLSNNHQKTRLWFTWPLAKIERIVCLHYPANQPIASNEIPSLVARYQTRYQAIVQAILEFEDRFYNNHPKAKSLKASNQHNNYVSFEQIIADQNANYPSREKKALKHLRNIALHDGSPGTDIKASQERAKIFPISSAEIEIEDIGKDLLNRLAKLP